jgi:hypothetical protein
MATNSMAEWWWLRGHRGTTGEGAIGVHPGRCNAYPEGGKSAVRKSIVY